MTLCLRGGKVMTYVNDQFVIDVANNSETNQTEFIVSTV